MDIAVVGGGIAGLGAAFLLAPRHRVTLYERNAWLGGHSRTIEIEVGGRRVPVDTGFMVFNRRNYPLLSGLFSHLGVEVAETRMSYGVSIAGGWLEYSGSGLAALFGQRRNLLRPRFWQMLADILRFNRGVRRYIPREGDATLASCLDALGVGEWIRRYYLYPMIGAIWSVPVAAVADLPARPYMEFFHAHGLLTVTGQPQWYSVVGGSRTYVERMAATLEGRVRRSCAATRIRRTPGAVEVTDAAGDTGRYEHVVIATHPDQALAMLEDPSAAERAALGAIHYQPNAMIVHRDRSFLPRRRACWSCWNYLSESAHDASPSIGVSYWLDRLQSLAVPHPIIATLNPVRRPAQADIYDEFLFHHPRLDAPAFAAQRQIAALQGERDTSYCGAYMGHGFHEDGLESAVAVAGRLGAELPWK